MTTRSDRLHLAVMDEIVRLNEAIAAGRVPTLKTWGGEFPVSTISNDLWAHCKPDPNTGLKPPYPFMLANDNTWADLLKQAGVERNDLFA